MKRTILAILACALQMAYANADQPSPGGQLSGSGETNAPPQQTDQSQPTDTTPDATLKLHGGVVAAGIGYVWGRGVVNYHGADHRFRIHGVSVIDVGGAKISAKGVVMHLSDIKDFGGTYVAWGAGITIAGGGSAVYLKNEHGVVIKLISQTEGLRFNLSGDGVKITLDS
jgi:hypothetical protein